MFGRPGHHQRNHCHLRFRYSRAALVARQRSFCERAVLITLVVVVDCYRPSADPETLTRELPPTRQVRHSNVGYGDFQRTKTKDRNEEVVDG